MGIEALGKFFLNNNIDLRSLDLGLEDVRVMFNDTVRMMLEAPWVRQAVADENRPVPERVMRLLDYLLPAGTMAVLLATRG